MVGNSDSGPHWVSQWRKWFFTTTWVSTWVMISFFCLKCGKLHFLSTEKYQWTVKPRTLLGAYPCLSTWARAARVMMLMNQRAHEATWILCCAMRLCGYGSTWANSWACAIFIAETLGDVCSLPSILILKFHVVSTDFFIFGFCFHVCTCRASNCCCQLLRWRGWRTSKKEGLGHVLGDSKWLEMMTPYHWTVATHQSEAAGDMCWYCLELVCLSWHLLSTGW